MPLLQVRSVTKIYGKRKVVDGVSIEVDSGEVVGLLGRNGAGKTTTFRMVVGLVRPNGGAIDFKGEEISRLPIFKRARRGMGFLPQEHSIFQRLTVEENLLAILETMGISRANRRERAARMLEEYGLARLAPQKAFTLSGGETRRLEICRAMLTNPSIVLLDEPFSGVDPIAVRELQGFITQLRDRRIGVLLTDHNVRETLIICNRAYIIDEGRVLKTGTPAEIVADPLVRQRYLGTDFRMPE
ncbi:MAG TPA: LPS export ABC transporter ATP-binding protein [Planctomycetota bacterium]|jgi:lipopolysaccharide export system ATP-binding protein|nr:LPS export ABC transporter ATP-binding protein [Planctomycetota bacterium]